MLAVNTVNPNRFMQNQPPAKLAVLKDESYILEYILNEALAVATAWVPHGSDSDPSLLCQPGFNPPFVTQPARIRPVKIDYCWVGPLHWKTGTFAPCKQPSPPGTPGDNPSQQQQLGWQGRGRHWQVGPALNEMASLLVQVLKALAASPGKSTLATAPPESNLITVKHSSQKCHQ